MPDIDFKTLDKYNVTGAAMDATDGMEKMKPLVCGFNDASTGKNVYLNATPLPTGDGFKYEGVTKDDVAPKRAAEIQLGISQQQSPTASFCVGR